jgi:23S rRNA pseudouridine2605 synthase
MVRSTQSGPEAPTSKLQKRLAEAGLGSRRSMEELIQSGQVTVNGRVAQLGARVGAGDRIAVAGEPLPQRRFARQAREPRVVLYHKPEGEIVSRHDPEGRPSVFDRVPVVQRGRWLAVGRLDFNTCGLLLFTDSGELANRLTHPRFQQPRDYAVRIVGELGSEQMRSLRSGVALDDGPARFELLEPQGGEGTNRWYRVRVREGRNRLVRRMFAAAGMTVSRLMRTRFGPFELPPRLKRGHWLRLDAKEVERALLQLEPKPSTTTPRPAQSRPPGRFKRPRVAQATGNDSARRPHRPRRPARAR